MFWMISRNSGTNPRNSGTNPRKRTKKKKANKMSSGIGKLIVLEGVGDIRRIGGIGRIKRKNPKFVFVDFPWGEETCNELLRMAEAGEYENEIGKFDLIKSAAIVAQRRIIGPALREGRIVICNRYWPSILQYGEMMGLNSFDYEDGIPKDFFALRSIDSMIYFCDRKHVPDRVSKFEKFFLGKPFDSNKFNVMAKIIRNAKNGRYKVNSLTWVDNGLFLAGKVEKEIGFVIDRMLKLDKNLKQSVNFKTSGKTNR